MWLAMVLDVLASYICVQWQILHGYSMHAYFLQVLGVWAVKQLLALMTVHWLERLHRDPNRPETWLHPPSTLTRI